MSKDIAETLTYSSYYWSLGTTSFRTKEFNYSIEKQLACLEDFWRIPENSDKGWEKKYMAPGQKDIYEIKNRYYDFMRDRGLTTGDDNVKYKAAREKTSGLVDLGLINENHRLTEVGKRILEISIANDYTPDNPLGISKDSYIYLKQLLKTFVKTGDITVRPFLVLLHMFAQLEYLTREEFTYLAPLCTSREITDEMIRQIRLLRDGRVSVDDIIMRILMSRPNYQTAYKVFVESDVTEKVITQIGLNRKSREYDKPYFPFYLLLREVFLEHKAEKIYLLYQQTLDIKNVGLHWRKLFFNTTSRTAIKKSPEEHLNETAFSRVSTEEQLRDVFFKTLHLIKAKSTLYDYYDLNRRYLNTANVLLFEDDTVKLDLVPKQYFMVADEQLYELAFIEAYNLEEDCAIESICPALVFDEQAIVEGLNVELGIHLTNIHEAYTEVEQRRYERFNKLIRARFPDEILAKLLDDFDARNDNSIIEAVTDNADVPTIFEYVLAIIWYKVSGFKGRVLDYMKLSLDANLLPITHAAGGEADIVYEYEKTDDYPAHTLLLEATLADSTNQRRLEMEPVSRHLGNHLLRSENNNSYCIFITNYLDKNVISDFRMRKVVPFYDVRDDSRFVLGMKIIPIQTSDLKNILLTQKTYAFLYKKYEKAFQMELGIKMSVLPKEWYNNYIREES